MSGADKLERDADFEARRRERHTREREQELKELREDPRYIAAVRQGEQERAAREAAKEQRRRTEAELRESEARTRLQAEKERQRRLWISSGNPAEHFEEMWPEIEKQVSWRTTELLAVATSPSSDLES